MKLEHAPEDRDCPHCRKNLERGQEYSYKLLFRTCLFCRGKVSNGLNEHNTGNPYRVPRKPRGG